MIIDKLSNAHLYYNINNRITEALKYLRVTDFENIETGRHDIDGENIYALVNDYQTKSSEGAKPEAHKKYIDVQYVFKGAELIGYASLDGQTPVKVYDEEKDYSLYDKAASFIKFSEGMFAVLFPDDLHMPGIAADKPTQVRKIVIKVKI